MTKARDIASAAPAPSTVSATELGYLDGVSSAIQTQIDSKQAANAAVSTTELGYLDGVTSAIQTQLDAKIPKTLTTTTGDIIYASSANTPARLGIGSTSQVLTVSGGVPAWATPSSGALTKIVSTTFSSVSTQDFLGCFTSTYRTYKIVFANIISSTNADMQLKLYKSGNTLLDDYSGGVMQISTAGTPTAAFNNSYLTVFSFGKINSSVGNQFAGGEITLFQGSELVGAYGATSGITSWQSGGGVAFRIGYYGSLNIDGNDAITGFQVLPSTGTISGTVTVYGLEK